MNEKIRRQSIQYNIEKHRFCVTIPVENWEFIQKLSLEKNKSYSVVINELIEDKKKDIEKNV